MRAFIDRMWSQLREYFSKMSRKNKIQLLILSVIVITLAIVTVSLFGRTTYGLMARVDTPAEAGAIRARLEEMGVPVQTQGTSILVPEARVDELRNTLASEGYLGGTGFNRDNYLAEAAGFGVPDSHSKLLYDLQKGDDIATLILQNSTKIQKCLAIVNSGDTTPFRVQTNTRRPTCAVMLTLRNGEILTRGEANAIGEIVKASIPGIQYEDIAISDSEFNYYSAGDTVVDPEVEMGHRIALTNRMTEQIKLHVEEMLAPVYGINNLEIRPYVRLNFDKKVTNHIEYFPPIAGETDGIVRTIEELYEQARNRARAEGIPGTDPNGMGTVEYPWGPFNDEDDYRKTLIGRNFEINELTTIIEHEQGYIDFVSISVNINSEIEGLEDYTEQVKDLVAKASNASPGNISVQHLPFSFKDTSMEDAFARWEEHEAAQRRQALIDMIVMYAVILALGVMIILLIRTVFKTLRPPPEPEPVLIAAGPGGISIDLLVDGEDEDAAEEERYEEIDLQQKSAGLEQIEKFIDKDSAAVAQLLRNWLSDDM